MEINELKKDLEKYIDQTDWLQTQIAINNSPVNITEILKILRQSFWDNHKNLVFKYFRAWGTRNIFRFPYDCYITKDEKFVVRNFNNYFHFLKVTSLNSAVLSSENPDDFWNGYPDYYIFGDFPEIVMMQYIIKTLEEREVE